MPAPVVSGRESTRRRIAVWRKARSSTRDRSRETGARRGGSFATASTHASCQCLAITRPPVTRQSGPSKSAGGAMTRRHRHRPIRRAGIAIGGRASRARSSVDPWWRRGLVTDWRRAGSSTRIVSEKRRARRGGSFATASTHASCQCLAIMRPPVTTPTRSQGRGRSDDTATASVRHPRARVAMSRVAD